MTEAVALVRHVLAAVLSVPQTHEGRDVYAKAVFALALARAGGDATDLVAAVERDLSAQPPPNRALLGMYLSHARRFPPSGLERAEMIALALLDTPRPEHERV